MWLRYMMVVLAVRTHPGDRSFSVAESALVYFEKAVEAAVLAQVKLTSLAQDSVLEAVGERLDCYPFSWRAVSAGCPWSGR